MGKLTNPDDMTLLSSRRAYEFDVDDLRITVVTLPPVQALIREAFNFESVDVRRPVQTFGPVPRTIPPGVVFDVGMAVLESDEAVPIRFLHFEQRRIVIDIVGPSSAIDEVFARLSDLLEQVPLPSGIQALKTPARVLDWSEYTFRAPGALSRMVNTSAWRAFSDALRQSAPREVGMTVVPVIAAQIVPEDAEYGGAFTLLNTGQLRLATRAGSNPRDHVIFSGAPLSSDDHRAYLRQIATVLGRSPAKRS